MRRPIPSPIWAAIALTLWLATPSHGYELLIHGVVPVGGEVSATNHVQILSGGLSLSGLSTSTSLQEFAGFLFPSAQTVSESPELEAPSMTQFRGVAPNPFRLQTTIHFDVGSSDGDRPPTRFEIYDVTGRAVRLLVNDHLEPGRYSFSWDGTNEQNQPVNTGVYFGRFSSGDVIRTVRLIPSR